MDNSLVVDNAAERRFELTRPFEKRLRIAKKNGCKMAGEILAFAESERQQPHDITIDLSGRWGFKTYSKEDIRLVRYFKAGTLGQIHQTWTKTLFVNQLLNNNVVSETDNAFELYVSFPHELELEIGSGPDFIRECFDLSKFDDDIRFSDCRLYHFAKDNWRRLNDCENFFTKIIPCRGLIARDKDSRKIHGSCLIYDNVEYLYRTNTGRYGDQVNDRPPRVFSVAGSVLRTHTCVELLMRQYLASHDVPLQYPFSVVPVKLVSGTSEELRDVCTYDVFSRLKLNLDPSYTSARPQLYDLPSVFVYNDELYYCSNNTPEGYIPVYNEDHTCNNCFHDTNYNTYRSRLCSSCCLDLKEDFKKTIFGWVYTGGCTDVADWGRVPNYLMDNGVLTLRGKSRIMLHRLLK